MSASEIARAYERFLLGFPNVVGVGTGKSEQQGLDEEFIRVYVSRKLPRDALGRGEVVPEWLEGYPVIVEEVGEIQALETPPLREPDAVPPTRGRKVRAASVHAPPRQPRSTKHEIRNKSQ